MSHSGHPGAVGKPGINAIHVWDEEPAPYIIGIDFVEGYPMRTITVCQHCGSPHRNYYFNNDGTPDHKCKDCHNHGTELLAYPLGCVIPLSEEFVSKCNKPFNTNDL